MKILQFGLEDASGISDEQMQCLEWLMVLSEDEWVQETRWSDQACLGFQAPLSFHSPTSSIMHYLCCRGVQLDEFSHMIVKWFIFIITVKMAKLLNRKNWDKVSSKHLIKISLLWNTLHLRDSFKDSEVKAAASEWLFSKWRTASWKGQVPWAHGRALFIVPLRHNGTKIYSVFPHACSPLGALKSLY